MTNVKYVDLQSQWLEERSDLVQIFENVGASGVFIGGDEVEAFEAKAANACGRKYCVALNSGTDALVCALVALGVGRGDEVITPPNSFIASTAAIVHIGAKPVFADVLEDQSIDPDAVEKSITPRTKAIMPVHLTGRMAQMDRIQAIAASHGLVVIEDAAQSIGSKYKSRLSGAFGDVGCFSTHPLKNLNACGDGGFIVTDEAEIHLEISRLRNHGLVDRNTVEQFGYVSRMDALQAAILSYRIDKLDQVIGKRRENAQLYKGLLDTDHIYFPSDAEQYFDSYHTFVIQCADRDALSKYLESEGVQTAIHYPIPIHLQPASRNLPYHHGDFPVTERQAGRIITLPINQFLEREQIEFVANRVNNFFVGK